MKTPTWRKCGFAVPCSRRRGAQERVDDWVATISSTFTKPSEDLRRRTANPLGFKVIDYRREPEVGEAAVPETKGGAL